MGQAQALPLEESFIERIVGRRFAVGLLLPDRPRLLHQTYRYTEQKSETRESLQNVLPEPKVVRSHAANEPCHHNGGRCDCHARQPHSEYGSFALLQLHTSPTWVD